MILELFALTVENMAKLNKANGVLKYTFTRKAILAASTTGYKAGCQ
jgi:hypothetical protein